MHLFMHRCLLSPAPESLGEISYFPRADCGAREERGAGNFHFPYLVLKDSCVRPRNETAAACEWARAQERRRLLTSLFQSGPVWHLRFLETKDFFPLGTPEYNRYFLLAFACRFEIVRWYEWFIVEIFGTVGGFCIARILVWFVGAFPGKFCGPLRNEFIAGIVRARGN